jgi:hypothetical protein
VTFLLSLAFAAVILGVLGLIVFLLFFLSLLEEWSRGW